MRFCVVTETSVPEESPRLLADASRARGIPFELVIAKTFDFDPARRLQAGDMLYNTATSVAASRAEVFLFAPGVATFYSSPNGIYFHAKSQPQMAEHAGIPMPRTVYLGSSNPALLKQQVERVGGFPVVLKILGRSSGIGVMLAESMASLRSQVDYAIAQGQNPLLCQFIANALHWRVIVLGGKVIASYRNKPVPDDFRSCGSTDRTDFDAPLPPAVADTAMRATSTMGLEFAGVDVLEDPSGQPWFLEANFPCYYPHAQLHGGVDIAGAMVEFLAQKAGHGRMAPAPAAEVRRLSNMPDVFSVDNFLDEAECQYVLARAAEVEADPPPEIRTKRDTTGFSFEMPVKGDAVLLRLMDKIHRAVGMTNDRGLSFRFRRYAEGEWHRPHVDEYEMRGCLLLATAILYLTDTESGGETKFPHAQPGPVRIAPRRGRMGVWFNYHPDGTANAAAVHESLPVVSGLKATITEFIYRKLEDYADLRHNSPILQTPMLESAPSER